MQSFYNIGLVILLLCWLSGLHGQEIRGTVLNSSDERIEFANIIWLEESTQEVMQYTITDKSGSYRLKVDKWQGLLIVSSLGFQSDTIRISAPQAGNLLQIDFKLAESTFNLQSIEVSDTRIPYKTHGDTTTYQSDFFTDGTEEVIEDLVKKLPGASVGDDGTIFYKGKQVDKVLLEDDALFGSKYTVATRSLRADVVDEIQFIDHYVENNLLKEVSQTDQLAMNITIKEDRKKLLFGDVHLGGGIPDRYDGRLNAFSLYKKHKAILVGGVENTASSTLDMYTLFGEGISFDDPYEYSRPARYFVHLPAFIPFELERPEVKNGSIAQGAANVVLHPGKKLRIKSYGLGFTDQWKLNSSSFFRDLNLGNRYEYEDHSLYNEFNHGLELNTEALWQLSKRSNMKYNFNISQNQLAGMANLRVSRPEQDTIIQDLDNDSRVHAHRLNWVSKLNENQVLVVDGAYYTNRKQQDFRFAFRPDTLGELKRVEQTNRHEIEDVDLLANLLGKKDKMKYAFSLKYRGQTDVLHVQTDSREGLDETLPLKEQWENKYDQQMLAVMGSISTQLGIAHLFSKVEIGYRQAMLEHSTNLISRYDDIYPNLRAGLDLSLSKRSAILISGAINTRFPEMQQVAADPMLTSYRSLTKGVIRIDPYHSYSAMLAFNHSNNAKLMEFSVNSVFIGNARAYTDQYFYEGIFAIRESRVVNGGYHWNLNASLDKYFPELSANIGFKYNGSTGLSYLLSSDASPNQVHLHTDGVELSYTTVFDGPLNVGIIANSSWSRYRRTGSGAPLQSKSNRLGLEYFLTVKPIKQLFLKVDTRQVFTRNQGKAAKNIYLGKLRSEYQVSTAFRIGCTIHNLWNTRRFNLETLGGESYSFQEWQLNPRMILAHIGLRF